MASKSQSQKNHKEWNPMRDDYNNTNYDPQYEDDNMRDKLVQLDHTKLYVTNIPQGLNTNGLRTLFEKYGTLVKIYVSSDPKKRFSIIAYDTAGEAKQAMMKLNRTDPLRLNIAFAHMQRKDADSSQKDRFVENSRNNYHDDNSSCSSREKKSHKPVNMANGDKKNYMHQMEEDLDTTNPELDVTVALEMKQFKLQKEQLLISQQLLLLKQQAANKMSISSASNRSILPDGRIVLRNHNNRAEDNSRDSDSTFTAGAGDARGLPALQRSTSHCCVACGQPADSFCARCGVTPYCGKNCQSKDWTARHKNVCHNLVLSGSDYSETDELESVVPKATPLRRPRSPAVVSKQEERQNNEGSQNRIFGPPNHQLHNSKDKTPNRQGNFQNNSNKNQRNNNRSRDGNKRFSNNNFDNGANIRRPDLNRDGGSSSHNKDTEDWESTKKPVEKSESPKVNIPMEEKKPVPTTTEEPASPQEVQKKLTAAAGILPGSVSAVTPKRNFIPKNYLIELLSIGDSALLSVDNKSSECRTKVGRYVCLSMHENFEEQYTSLCEDYAADCLASHDTFTLQPGDLFSYLNSEDGGYYRARCLNQSVAALLDGSKLVEINITDKYKKISSKYKAIPEFSCVLDVEGVQIGDNLKCTILSKTASDGYKVSLENVETNAPAGIGEISRWKPDVDYPEPKASAAPQTGLPEIIRPEVVNNSKVFIVDATSFERVFVRPSDNASQRLFDHILQDIVLHGQKAKPLAEPPKKGQTVIGKFTDGLHYRALCIRTNVKQNKYLLEYIEFGNIEISHLEDIYPCPPELDITSKPTVVSMVMLKSDCKSAFTPPAIDYLDNLKDNNVELILTTQSGNEVTLTVESNKDNVNRKLQEICTPDWKKIEEKGGNIVTEMSNIMYSELTYLTIPADGCELDVLDLSAFECGNISACVKGNEHAKYVFNQLTQKMAEYCDSEIGKAPYLPKIEELCLAKCPPYPQWFRAVMLEQVSGAGGSEAKVCFIDYGNIESISVSLLRKILKEFVENLPAVVAHLEIRDFPVNPSEQQLAAALVYMKVNDDGRGTLKIVKCDKTEEGFFMVEAPELIEAMKKAK